MSIIIYETFFPGIIFDVLFNNLTETFG